MKIILKDKIENLGNMNSIVNVKAGYARNYLVPYGKAVQATKENIVALKIKKKELQKTEQQFLIDAKGKSEKLMSKVYTIRAQAGRDGKLFGSIGAKEISKVIANETGIEIKKRNIRMPNNSNIKSTGKFELSIRLNANIFASIKLIVETNESPH